MTAASFSQFLQALRRNVKHYETELGPLKPRFTPPRPAPSTAPAGEATGPANDDGSAGGGASDSDAPGGGAHPQPAFSTVHDTLPHGPPTSAPVTDLYEQVKFPEDLLGGAFANAVMIRHTPEEFCFDFISNLYPRPIVASRVYVSAGRIPSFIDAMTGSMGRFERGGQ